MIAVNHQKRLLNDVKIETRSTAEKSPIATSSAMGTNNRRKSRAWKKLEEALQLDQSFNNESEQSQTSGEAVKLMYAILPKNSNVIRKISSKTDRVRSRSADSTPLKLDYVENLDPHNSFNGPIEHVDQCNKSTPKQNRNKIKNFLSISEKKKSKVVVPSDKTELSRTVPDKQNVNVNFTNNSTTKQGVPHVVEEAGILDESSVTEVPQSDFRMRVDPGEDDFDEESTSEEDNQNNESDSSVEEDLDQFQNQDQGQEIPIPAAHNIPALNFDEFKERPEVKDFMIKMFQATVENKSPSLLQRQARTVNQHQVTAQCGQ